jgi:hypothetical protein
MSGFNSILALIMDLNEPYDDEWEQPYQIDSNGYCTLIKFAGQTIFHPGDGDREEELTKDFLLNRAKDVLKYLEDPESTY